MSKVEDFQQRARTLTSGRSFVVTVDPTFKPADGDQFDALQSALEHFEIPSVIVERKTVNAAQLRQAHGLTDTNGAKRLEPQECTFAQFRQIAEGRQYGPFEDEPASTMVWFRGSVLHRVQALGEEALRIAHGQAVFEALYMNSAAGKSDLLGRKMNLPSKAALDEYPQLRNQFPSEAASVDMQFIEQFLHERGFRVEAVPGSMPGEPVMMYYLKDGEALSSEEAPKQAAAAAHLWSLLLDRREGVISQEEFDTFGGNRCWEVIRAAEIDEQGDTVVRPAEERSDESVPDGLVPYTVLGSYADNRQLFVFHVFAKDGLNAFAVAAQGNPNAEFTAAVRGHLTDDAGALALPGESVVDAQTVEEQPDVFGSVASELPRRSSAPRM